MRKQIGSSRTGLAERIESLVALFHDGNTAQAARAYGVTQSTVWRLREGQVSTVAILAKIAERDSVSLDWLISGKGQGPDASGPLPPHLAKLGTPAGKRTAGAMRWARVLEMLKAHGLSEEGATNWQYWPTNEITYAASALYDFGLTDANSDAPEEVRDELGRAFSDATDAYYEAASILVERLVRVLGEVEVATQMDARRDDALWGFDRRARDLARMKSDDPELQDLLGTALKTPSDQPKPLSDQPKPLRAIRPDWKRALALPTPERSTKRPGRPRRAATKGRKRQ
jgi:transcriptional regulator with XRE-family HTH domain